MFSDSQQLCNLFFGEVFGHGGFQRGAGHSRNDDAWRAIRAEVGLHHPVGEMRQPRSFCQGVGGRLHGYDNQGSRDELRMVQFSHSAPARRKFRLSLKASYGLPMKPSSWNW